ncbi:MAG: oligoribonuclease [Chloroflexota bacterium]
MSEQNEDNRLVWLDLEMTGLDPETDVIVQIAIVITDRDLNEVADPLELTIWQPPEELSRMIPFVRAMHEKTGLLRQAQESETSVADAEREALALVSLHCSYRTARLCGNSICQDRRFLARHMPALENYLHYRMIDVSTVKELAGWWYGIHHRKPEGAQHTALWDARQSIEELKFYRERIFKDSG